MRFPTFRRSWAFTMATLVVLACLAQAALSWSATEPNAPNPSPVGTGEKGGMTPTKKAESLGIKFEKLEPRYLNHCVKAGKLLFTSGFGSKTKGRLGRDMKVEDGYKAARECGVEILRAVHDRHGTLDNLRVVKVLGCVNSTADFYEQPKVINGCSDLLHQIFGAKTDGWHARSALGFAALPNGCAVEIEAIFEIKD
jgi:enamine deaminase RidA (YjgF/YER057c/UK114 family)